MAILRSKPWTGHLEVHIFEQGGYFGAGEVYRPDQPEYLKTNIPTTTIMRSLHEDFDSLPEAINDINSVTAAYRDSEFMPRSATGKILL